MDKGKAAHYMGGVGRIDETGQCAGGAVGRGRGGVPSGCKPSGSALLGKGVTEFRMHRRLSR